MTEQEKEQVDLLLTEVQLDLEIERGYLEWVRKYFPHVCTAPFGEHHLEVWDWFNRLELGQSIESLTRFWARGGGKSTTIELATTYVAVAKKRQFALFVSGTQEQARDHVGSLADYLQAIGIERALNPYGQSKGWRADRLRAANGFNAVAFGMDTALRGVKLGHVRPDLIVIDDIDDIDDSPKTVEKKIVALTQSILPTGSPDCAVVFIENLIHENSIASHLAENRADFLLDRTPSQPVPAVVGLETETYILPNGIKQHRIIAGTAVWPGQSIEICEKQMNKRGLKAFLREAQHEVGTADGYFFDHKSFEIVDEVPKDRLGWRYALGWDLAATEGGGDYTSCVLMARSPAGVIFVLDVLREQWSTEKVRAEITNRAIEARRAWGPDVRIRLPQDPGQAGKFQARELRRDLKQFEKQLTILPVTGSKATRAEPWAGKVNSGNVKLLKADWNWYFTEEHRKFRADEEHEFDDIVDAAGDAFKEVSIATFTRPGVAIRRN